MAHYFPLICAPGVASAVDSGLIPIRVKPMTLIWLFTVTVYVWKTSQKICSLCHWKRHLAGFPHLSAIAGKLIIAL